MDVGESYVQALPRIDSGFEQWVGTSSPAREQARHLPSDAPSGSRGRLDPHSPRPTVGNCGTRLFSAERFFTTCMCQLYKWVRVACRAGTGIEDNERVSKKLEYNYS